MNIRNRVRELRHVAANELRPNPKNWRTHPKAQQDALRGVLAEVGMADACLARELPDGTLMLIDGHLRAETAAAAIVPVLILDVDEAEADKILATLDPLSAMAETDATRLDALLRTVDTGSDALQEMLASTAAEAGLYLDDESPGDAAATPADGDDAERLYTDKVDVPIYAKIGDKPPLESTFDDSKCVEMLRRIDASNAPEDVKRMLKAAAYRHVVFDFTAVANFYAHSDADTQRLMEDSALVIVDVGAAIKSGWAQLSSELEAIYAAEKEQDAA